MKKLIAVFAVLLFVAPAFAADWAFYGSQRVGTWYVDRDYGDDVEINGQSDDQATELAFQGNSRLGVKVKADKVTGQIELGLSADGFGSGGDSAVQTRRAYGTWKFSDNAALKVGKDYSPVTDFISNQMIDGDADLLGVGNFYGRRPAGLTLILGNFELAALTPSYGYDVGSSSTGIYQLNAAGTSLSALSTGDPDSYIPRFEASYNLKLGPGYIKPFGGFQYYTVDQGNSTVITDDIDVWSWVAGVSTSWNIGAFSIGGQLSYGMNEGAVQGWAPGVNQAPGSTLSGSQSRSGSSPILKSGGDDIEDAFTTQALLVAALKFTDTIRLEAGGGYRVDESDASGAEKDEVWSAYLQVMFTLAPGVYLIPEVGYFDFLEDGFGNDQGIQWYGGAKWQIDF
jgi:hypothetical protein